MATALTVTQPTQNNDDNSKVIEGYSLHFNTLSDDLGGFRETLEPHCLDGTDMSDVRCLINHEPSLILGRNNSNLELKIDETGLFYRCTLPNTSYANDLYENIKSGLITQCSFGFIVADGGETWKDDGNGSYLRTISKIDELFDVSPVTFPAYRQTEVTVASRSLDRFKQSIHMQDDDYLKRMQIKLKLAELANKEKN